MTSGHLVCNSGSLHNLQGQSDDNGNISFDEFVSLGMAFECLLQNGHRMELMDIRYANYGYYLCTRLVIDLTRNDRFVDVEARDVEFLCLKLYVNGGGIKIK